MARVQEQMAMARSPVRRVLGFAAATAVLALALTACTAPVDYDYPDDNRSVDAYSSGSVDEGSVFGPGGINIFGGGSEGTGAEGGGGIGVNSFLWRASLDTLSFMPLSSADPFGGVIITDWYSLPESPEERFKMTVYILDRRLRADGLKVAVFRQLKDQARQWSDAAVSTDTAIQLENAILTRARQLRLKTQGQ
ncbi:MAG: DUF3576 domain-containing protein [Alphaproteobacteria bacterium]|nr:DUF3576 domain-containing protein [Alphaproteobacteria bacterium]